MAGISSKALAFGEPNNKLKYNGYEQQNEEFSDGSGLELYDYKHRFYDNQIGRFFCVDALSDKFPYYTPYQFAGNEVPNAIDLDGLEPSGRAGRGTGPLIDAYQFMQNRRSYRQINSYVPNPRSYRTSGTYIPNQQPAKTPALIYEHRESSLDPTIIAGNSTAQRVTNTALVLDNLKEQINNLNVSTDTWLNEDAGGNATIATTRPEVKVEWKTKEAEAAFNVLQTEYKSEVDKIKKEQRVIAMPGANASQEEWVKYAKAVNEAVLGTQAKITLLGPSPALQLANSAGNTKDFKKVKTETKIIPEFRSKR